MYRYVCEPVVEKRLCSSAQRRRPRPPWLPAGARCPEDKLTKRRIADPLLMKGDSRPRSFPSLLAGTRAAAHRKPASTTMYLRRSLVNRLSSCGACWVVPNDEILVVRRSRATAGSGVFLNSVDYLPIDQVDLICLVECEPGSQQSMSFGTIATPRHQSHATPRLLLYWPVPVRGLIRKFLQSQMHRLRSAALAYQVRRSVFRG